jgi:HIRAN domain
MKMKTKKPKHKTTSTDFTVVGIRHRFTADSRRELAGLVPFAVGLKREPLNIHDENAIAVLVLDDKLSDFRGMKMGYLTRQVASAWALLIDSGKVEVLSAVIEAVDAEDGTARVKVAIRK